MFSANSITKNIFVINRVIPKWKGNSVNSANSGNLSNHWSMNYGQFKDRLSHVSC